MNMIGNTTYSQHRALQFAAQEAKKLMDFIPNSLVINERVSIFGGKDNVQVVLDERLSHGTTLDAIPSG
jgi:hypothetical protein